MTENAVPAINRKVQKGVKELLARSNYLVVEANDLAHAFGRLSSFEQNMLDFSVSFIKKEDTGQETYETDILDILNHFGLPKNGKNYKRVIEAYRNLNVKTPVYIQDDGGIIMTHMFAYIDVRSTGKVKFEFSRDVTPLLFDLRKNYFSFKLSELGQMKSKYSKILMRLWQANKVGNQDVVTISGVLSDWELWFRGKDVKSWPAGQFKRDVLDKAMAEVGAKMNVWFDLITIKHGRNVVGYELTIHDDKSAVLEFGK